MDVASRSTLTHNMLLSGRKYYNLQFFNQGDFSECAVLDVGKNENIWLTTLFDEDI